MKDENAPKLPQTGYVMYMNERRDAVKSSNPNITFPELTKKIASEWSQMDTDNKKVAKYCSMKFYFYCAVYYHLN